MPGVKDVLTTVPQKSQVNASMRSLWWWAQKEIQAPYEILCELWRYERIWRQSHGDYTQYGQRLRT